MPFTFGISLEKHGTRGKFGCVSGDGEGGRDLKEMENEFGQK